MIMWIILGSLVGIVIIFLIVTSTLDRKKARRVNSEKATLNVKVDAAGVFVAKAVTKVIKANEKAIENFVPSVGKVKMSDINLKAKNGLKDIMITEHFKLLKHTDEKYDNFESNIETLIKTKSNNWKKRNAQEIKFFKEYKEEVPAHESMRVNK